ncbi:hypothetical protein B0J17DRAFT_646372 [Rhizoctonia solani]|nr:hypothetical protein B0J17DRAFT_646372 [Rhizoctonia solani]
MIILRRRRARRMNGGDGPFHHDKHPKQPESYQPYPGGGPEYANQNGHGHGTPNYPVNEPQAPAPIYQGNGGYAPPNGPPPNHYAPPAGPPPAK